MLLFTPAQQTHVLNQRRAHYRNHQMMANSVAADFTVGNAESLPKDVWGEWDKEGVAIQRQVMTVFNDLAALSRPIAIGKIVSYFQTISDSGEVNISLDGRSKAKTDQPVFEYHGTPVPIADSTFSFGWRQMAAAQTEGESLDEAGRVNALYKVAEKAESLILDGDASVVVGGDTLYGLRTHPKRNTRTTSQALNGATGAQWLADVNATLKLLHDKNYKRPATLYVNWSDWFYATSTEYSTTYGDKSIAQKVMESEGVAAVVPSDTITASEIVAVIKDRQVLQVLNGMPINTRAQFRANPEDDYNFVTMTAVALQVKFDADDNCGVAHSSI